MKEEKTIFEQIKEMSIDELAEFLYYNADYISAEYCDASEERGIAGVRRFLNGYGE